MDLENSACTQQQDYSSLLIANIYMLKLSCYIGIYLISRYSVIKSLTHRGYNTMRPFRHLIILGPICGFGGLFRFVFYGEHNRGYE